MSRFLNALFFDYYLTDSVSRNIAWDEEKSNCYSGGRNWQYLRFYLIEANSSIEYFNDNDETVLQGETQYKHAE